MMNWIKKGLAGLVSIVATVVVTKLLSGEPLTGLTKLKGLSDTFLKSRVPAWAFALALFVAVLALWYIIMHWPTKTQKGTIHFVPDGHNNGWAVSGKQIELRLGGTFTNAGASGVRIMKIFLKGTKQVGDMMARTYQNPGPAPLTYFDLPSHLAVQKLINVRLVPAKGSTGKPLKAKIVLRDTYNEDYPLDPVELPYIGK
jgi:hypothetical protein